MGLIAGASRGNWIVKIVEVDVAILSTCSEAHIVVEPVDSYDFVQVTCELHGFFALVSVEVVDVNVLVGAYDGEQVATVAEFDLAAALHLQLLVVLNLVAQHFAHKDLVLQSEDNVQTAGMES